MESEPLGGLETLLREAAARASLAAVAASRAAPAADGQRSPPKRPASPPRSLAEVLSWIDRVSEPLARRLASR